jgi:hypothetical protein
MIKNKAKVMDGEDFVIDAIEMKRHIQEKIYEETKGMNAEELIAYFNKRVANSEFADFLSQPNPASTAVPADEKS